MKRLIVVIAVMALILVACSPSENATTDSMNKETSTEEMSTTETEMSKEDSEEKEEMKEETEEETKETADTEEAMVFNAETLAKYNGEDGMKAYVAVDGVVYDVTDVPAWQSPHAGRLKPGKDYSDEITKSPHGKKNLEGLEVVGTYEE